tara:strand:- start:696 stop:2447 length:1752 start_codon:yes stop_codon:yes gene_type:complete
LFDADSNWLNLCIEHVGRTDLGGCCRALIPPDQGGLTVDSDLFLKLGPNEQEGSSAVNIKSMTMNHMLRKIMPLMAIMVFVSMGTTDATAARSGSANFQFTEELHGMYFGISSTQDVLVYESVVGLPLDINTGIYRIGTGANEVPGFNYSGQSAKLYLFPHSAPASLIPAPVAMDGHLFQNIEISVPGDSNITALASFGFPAEIYHSGSSTKLGFPGHTAIEIVSELANSVSIENCNPPASLLTRNEYQCIYTEMNQAGGIHLGCPTSSTWNYSGILGPVKFQNTSAATSCPYPTYTDYIKTITHDDPLLFYYDSTAIPPQTAGAWKAWGNDDGNICLSRYDASPSDYLEFSDTQTPFTPPNSGASQLIYNGQAIGGNTTITVHGSGQDWLSWFNAGSPTLLGDLAYAFSYGYAGSKLHVSQGDDDFWRTTQPGDPNAIQIRNLNASNYGNSRKSMQCVVPSFKDVRIWNGQTVDDGHYDTYASIIAEKSDNTIYGHTYSDHYKYKNVTITTNFDETIIINASTNISSSIYGDANGDGVVDSADRTTVNAVLGVCTHDIDADGITDINDLLVVIEGWGTTCTP